MLRRSYDNSPNNFLVYYRRTYINGLDYCLALEQSFSLSEERKATDFSPAGASGFRVCNCKAIRMLGLAEVKLKEQFIWTLK
jgi:hypothetical protein